MGGGVVVFDFDHTMIEDNSDTWIVMYFGLSDLFHQLRRTLPWTSLMDRMMEELHSLGKTIEDIAECLRRIPMDLRIISAIKKARYSGCELWIISDANHFFIDTILKHHGLVECFTQIITNPSFVDDEGRLRILPYHNSLPSPHGCNLCPSNLCKGMVIEEIRVSMSKNGEKKMIYLGDGNGDYCPSLKLGETDHVMPRKDFPLWKRIRDNRTIVKAKVHDWGNGEEMEMILLQLIDDANSIEGAEGCGGADTLHDMETRENGTALNVERREMGGVVVVFDFDHTMIEDNSDTWIVMEFGLSDLFHQLRRTLPWTSLMDRMMEELHSLGKTMEDIAECLRRIPMDLCIIKAIKKARYSGCELWIISDANHFFIDTILKHHGLVECFTQIITNPSFVDDEGRLRILPYHNSLPSPHGCDLCPSNLCKGMVIEEIRVSMSKNGEKKMIYLGDGNGDYCPSLKLGETDHVMPRKDFPLWKRIRDNRTIVKAKVHDWGNGEEMEMILLQLIDDANSIEGTSFPH